MSILSVMYKQQDTLLIKNLLFHFGSMFLLISEGVLFCQRLKWFALWQMEMFIHVEWTSKGA